MSKMAPLSLGALILAITREPRLSSRWPLIIIACPKLPYMVVGFHVGGGRSCQIWQVSSGLNPQGTQCHLHYLLLVEAKDEVNLGSDRRETDPSSAGRRGQPWEQFNTVCLLAIIVHILSTCKIHLILPEGTPLWHHLKVQDFVI